MLLKFSLQEANQDEDFSLSILMMIKEMKGLNRF